MAKLSLALSALLAATASAFAPQNAASVKTALSASSSAEEALFKEVGGKQFDPLGLGKLGTPDRGFDTFPDMFPHPQYLADAELKNGRMAMLAWTGIWATTQGGFGLGLHIPGMPDEPDWTKALGVFSAEQPALFGTILLLICIAEGESISHSGDNWRGLSTKPYPGFLNFDYLGLGKKLSPEKQERYRVAEVKNGRAAMIAIASLFAFKSIEGSVPIMDLLGAQ